MHLLFEAPRSAKMWPSGTIKQTNAVKMEGHEAESHAGVVNPSGKWYNSDCRSSVRPATPGTNLFYQTGSNYLRVN